MGEDLLTRLGRKNFTIASFNERVLVYFIGNLVLLLIVFVIFYDKLPNAKDLFDTAQILGDFYLGFLLLHITYQTIFTYLYGASLGKMVCKVIILDEDLLGKPNLNQSCIRSIVRQINDMAFMLGFAWVLSNDLRKTWEGYLAKTMVVDVA